MNSCKTIDSLVTPYIDGELPDADERAVDQHLHICPPCYARVTAERAVRELIRARHAALKESTAPSALRAACAQIARFSRAESAEGARGSSRAKRPAWRD